MDVSGGTPLAALRERARSDDAAARQATAAALGRTGDAAAVEVLLTMLADRSQAVRRAALAALRQLGESDVAEAVLAVWQADPEPARRMGDDRLGPPLLLALGATWPAVRAAAAEALGYLPQTNAREELLNALEDPSPAVRATAARSLGRRKEAGALGRLLSQLQDGEANVRRDVVRALADLPDEVPVEPLLRLLHDADPAVRRETALGLGKLGTPTSNLVVKHLAGLLRRERTAAVRAAAAYALGQVGSRAGVEPLLVALDDTSDDVAAAAARALGRLGDPTALPLLSKMQRTWWEAKHVRQACENATTAIRHAAGTFGGELAPAVSPGGGTTEAVPVPAEAEEEPAG